MRICVAGHHVREPDEGVRRIAQQLSQELAQRHQVMPLSITDLESWPSLRAFKPDVIHSVLSPTLLGLAAARLLSITYRPAATVISAPHPDLGPWAAPARLCRPDLILVQAHDSERRFRSLGFRTKLLPNGVDITRFAPVERQTVERLRKKYGIERDRFVVLHVGPLTRGRNLLSMKVLQRDDTQVLIVGRASEKPDTALAGELRDAGCIVLTAYLSSIEETYALSDCYVFPTTNRRYCIEMPLSVLEAMSCNLPVVTTRFGALPRVFKEGCGFTFFDGEEELVQALDRASRESKTRTRDMVLAHSWAKVVEDLEDAYEGLLGL